MPGMPSIFINPAPRKETLPMKPNQTMTGPQAQAAALLRRWDRIGVGVRCGYNPFCTGAVRHYIEAGRRVAASGARAEAQVHQRMLTVLLQTARDEALPWAWRAVCLEHTTLPLARLKSLLKLHDPIACHALECAVQAAHDGLAATPPSQEREA